jgi:hypothetical protein
MAEESRFVAEALSAAEQVLRPPLSIRRGAALLYEVTVDNNLSLTVDPRRPVQGDSAFKTDLCVFETKKSAKVEDIDIPRVVLEFKTKITTHDIITYSVKARKHKQVYPYLRYGFVVSDQSDVPRRFFTHNESLDFCAALKNTKAVDLQAFLRRLLEAEVATSKRLEEIAFGNLRPQFFRMEVVNAL